MSLWISNVVCRIVNVKSFDVSAGSIVKPYYKTELFEANIFPSRKARS